MRTAADRVARLAIVNDRVGLAVMSRLSALFYSRVFGCRHDRSARECCTGWRQGAECQPQLFDFAVTYCRLTGSLHVQGKLLYIGPRTAKPG